jgi:hypothetical protein
MSPSPLQANLSSLQNGYNELKNGRALTNRWTRSLGFSLDRPNVFLIVGWGLGDAAALVNSMLSVQR